MKTPVSLQWVVDKFDNQNRRPGGSANLWKTFAVYSGAALQLGTCLVVFGYIGHLFAQKWNMPWLTAAGVFAGLVVGSVGLAYLIKRLLGELDE